MEDDFERRKAEEQAAKQQFYAEAVGSYKMARVSQLVNGEVHVRPSPPGPGAAAVSSMGGSGRSPTGGGLWAGGGCWGC